MAGQDLPMPARFPPASLLDVSLHLINSVVQRPVQKLEPVRDVILDAQVFGTSRTLGRVFARLQPNGDQAVLAIVLQGSSCTDALAYNDPVKVYTQTISNFEVLQPISLDAKGVRLLSPFAIASSQTCLKGITNMCDDPDSIAIGPATLTFKEDRPQIDRITARKTECKTTTSLRQELSPQIDKVGRGLNTALNVLAGLGVPMQPLRWSSTASHLHGEAGLVTSAPMNAPPGVPVSADLTLRVHQSVLVRIAQKNLAGKTYSALDLIKLRESIKSVLDSNPQQPNPDALNPDKVGSLLKMFKLEPVSITFSKTAPVEVDMNADGFTIKLRGSGFQQGGTDYPARTIRGRYRIETLPTEIALVREGSVQVLREGPYADLDDAKNEKMIKLLETSFNLFLPSRLLLPRITIPGERPLLLVPSQAATSPGWLTLAWQRK